MSASDSTVSAKSDFLAAEEIKEILGGREKSEQQRILRWVTESLELSAAVKLTTEHTSHLPEPVQPSSSSAAVRAKDIRSFVQEKQPKNDVQFVAVTAYFYRFIAAQGERKEAITSEDLQTAARLAQRPVFKGPSKTLNNAVQQGYMDRTTRGAVRVNAVGENLVSMTLPGAGGEGAATKHRARRRGRSANAPKGGSKRSRKSG